VVEFWSGERVVECDKLPVVVNGVICANVFAAVVLCAQVATSLVVTDSVVCVVLAAKLAVGAVMVTVGGVMSAIAWVVTLTLLDTGEMFPAASVALTV
jgi:hypothetical protein